METLLLIIDTTAMVLVLYWSLKNDKLPPGKPEEGWFRIADPAPKPVAQTGRTRPLAARRRTL